MKLSINVKLPKKLLANVKVQEAIEELMEKKSMPEVAEEFWNVTRYWDVGDPTIETSVTRGNTQIKADIYPFGNSMATRVFKMVSLGTPPHRISAKNRPLLHYQSGYTPATKPGSLLSSRARRHGRWMHKPYVNHPGMDARNFDELIAKKYDSVFREDVQDVINKTFQKEWGS